MLEGKVACSLLELWVDTAQEEPEGNAAGVLGSWCVGLLACAKEMRSPACVTVRTLT